MAKDDDILADAQADFELCNDGVQENYAKALEDLQFARLGEQWPDNIKRQREADGKPMLTINRMPSFIRQIVNDSRQNKPQVKVKPVDDSGDKETAEVIGGLIRNIEYTSKADIAYDTAVDFAVSSGIGYFRIGIDYEDDESFDKCLRIRRVANPFSVLPDPYSTEADSSDWNMAFVTEYMTLDEFGKKYKGADPVGWRDSYEGMAQSWDQDGQILLAEYWKRDKVSRKIMRMSNNTTVAAEVYKAQRETFDMMRISPTAEREVMAQRVIHRLMTGAEVLEETEWAGKYIPIVPVYGEELFVEGKRHFRSLIRDAKDAQRMVNYWRSTATELVALAPRVPFIGEEGAFDADPNWATANTSSHPYLMVTNGRQFPQRQPLDSGTAAGAMTEAMQAADDMKSIMGMFDASLGAKSNETSGKAIMARQREGDVATFHFIDNLARAIRHGANILVDMIPHVYSGERVVRVLGLDGTEETKKLGQQQGQPPEMVEGEEGQEVAAIYDLSAGKYDVAVETGPGYTTRREEARIEMTEVLRSVPQLGEVAGDLIVKAFDWPQAEEIAERIKGAMPGAAQEGIPPEMQQMIEQGQQELQRLGAENEKLKLDLEKKDIDIAKAQLATQKAGMAQQAQPAIEIPEQVGMAMIQTLAPAIAQAVAQAMAQPRRKVPVRDENGMIAYVDEMPMPQGAMQ